MNPLFLSLRHYTTELARGAELYVESKKQAKRLMKLVGALLLLMGLMLGAITVRPL